jgi:two-component system response regulator HydG
VLENRTARPVGGQVEYPVHCRFIAAANRDLLQMTRAGTFREDLYYRLNLFHIHLPALRERPEDIPLLAQAFLTRAAREYNRPITGFEPEAMDLLERFNWPGNVRQLRNAVERAVILCETGRISANDLPENIRGSHAASGPPRSIASGTSHRAMIENYERELIVSALDSTGGNISRAAKLLSIRRTTLHSRLAALGIRSAGQAPQIDAG